MFIAVRKPVKTASDDGDSVVPPTDGEDCCEFQHTTAVRRLPMEDW